MNEKLKKRFSVGISFGMSEEEFTQIVLEFSEFIHDFYFSPPFGNKFHSRKTVAENLSPTRETEKRFFRTLEFLADRELELNLALNMPSLPVADSMEAIRRVRERVPIDIITTTPRIAEEIRREYSDIGLVLSYHGKTKTKEDIKNASHYGFFDTIVLGNSLIRDFDSFLFAKNNGLKVKVLVNNGCCFDCNSFCNPGDVCKGIVENQIKTRRTEDQIYAEQSLMPWEIHKYYLDSVNVDLLKISSRPSSYQELRNCLMSYINNINREMIEKDRGNFHLWARLAALSSFYSRLDLDKINAEKQRIWESLS